MSKKSTARQNGGASPEHVTVFPKRLKIRLDDAPRRASGYPIALFMVLPEQFAVAEQSALDNRYMSANVAIDAARAKRQVLALARKLREAGQTVLLFPGDARSPDGLFPNNAFSTKAGAYLIGSMRHPIRQQETERQDLHSFFRDVMRYPLSPLRAGSVAELTGSMVIDRARGLGFCGLSERCNLLGAYAMHEAFALTHSLIFELAEGEYHTNVVMSALAGAGVVLAPSGFASPECAQTIADFYQDCAVVLSEAEKNAFAGNCIALSPIAGRRGQLWLSTRAADGISPHNRLAIEQLGFRLMTAELDEIEKAGGSLRCLLGEIF